MFIIKLYSVYAFLIAVVYRSRKYIRMNTIWRQDIKMCFKRISHLNRKDNIVYEINAFR